MLLDIAARNHRLDRRDANKGIKAQLSEGAMAEFPTQDRNQATLN
jgi:hypothetical protein